MERKVASYKDGVRYKISTMRKIVVGTMALHNFIRKSNLKDPDFQIEQEHTNEHDPNEEGLPNVMEHEVSSRQYMEGVRDEIANAMWIAHN